MTGRGFVVSGAMVRHQVKQYLNLQRGVEWSYMTHGERTKFFIQRATDEQWGQIQDWVKRLT